jgi:splicing factor 3B subunit 3
MVGLDVGLENPMFATLELSTENIDDDPDADDPDKMLVLYELDLGLNVMLRKNAFKVRGSIR